MTTGGALVTFSAPKPKLGTQVAFPEMADVKSPDLSRRLPGGGKVKIWPEIGDFLKVIIGYIHLFIILESRDFVHH